MYEKIDKVLNSKRNARNSTRLGVTTATITAAPKLIESVQTIRTASKYGKKMRQFKKDAKAAGVWKHSYDKAFNKAHSQRVILPFIKGAAVVLGIALPWIINEMSAIKDKKSGISRLTKMLQQGDVDPSDVFQFLKTADKREAAVCLAALQNIGYDGGDVASFVGYYRKNIKGR